MNKSILISIKPKFVEKILNGEKTIEIRKTMPKCELPIDVYIYCTKGTKHLVAPFRFLEGWKYKEYNDNTYYSCGCTSNIGDDINGKVVAKFTLNKIDKYDVDRPIYYQNSIRKNGKYIGELQSTELEILGDSWLTNEELENYLTDKNDEVIDKFYAWHIDNLEIFDKPKDLNEFVYNCLDDSKCENCPYYYCHNTETDSEKGCSCDCKKPLSKAPKSWCYVRKEE